MTRRSIGLVVVLATLTATGSCGQSTAPTKGPTTTTTGRAEAPREQDAAAMVNNKVAAAGVQLANFEKSRDVAQLGNAVDSMMALEPFAEKAGTPEWVAQRRSATEMWLQIIATIEKHRDPGFDPNAVPSTKVLPPKDGAVQFPPGIDPKHIKDAGARAAYEAAVKKNNDYVRFYDMQLSLQRLDERANMAAERFFLAEFGKSPEEVKAFEELVNASAVTKGRKAKLVTLITPAQA